MKNLEFPFKNEVLFASKTQWYKLVVLNLKKSIKTI